MTCTCRVCQLEKPEDEMVKSNRYLCKICKNEYNRVKKQELRQKRLENPNEEKECSKCNILKNINDYDVYSNICKICIFNENKIRRLELLENLDPNTEKKCIKCEIIKKSNVFVGITNTCKICNNEYRNQNKKDLLQKRIDNEIIEKCCVKCEILKDINEYGVGHNTCNQCRNDYNRQYANKSVKNYLRQLLQHAKRSAKVRTQIGRVQAGEISLTLENLESLYNKQNGLCYYSNIKLSLKRYSDWQCSLERIDPNRGYIIDNIALACGEFNGATQWTIQKYTEFIRLINIKYLKQNIDWNLPKEKQNRFKIITKIENGIEKCKCNKCDVFKPMNQFINQLSKGCIECRTNQKNQYRATAQGHMVRLFNDMKSSSKRRGFDPPEVNLEDLIELFDSQNGLCAYSGIPMTFGSYLDKWWVSSPERIDTLKGYTKDNVCLICVEFNTSDRSKCAIDQEEVTGSTGWNAIKIEYIKSL